MIDVTKLHAGDIVYLDEVIYTARDAAHLRIAGLLENNADLPVNFKDSFIYYAGPTPTKPDGIVGSIGPTTSSRMDKFVSMMPKLGVKGMIGKGPRSESVKKACQEYKMVYLIVTGGAGALLSKRVVSCEEVAFNDLGCESIKKLEVKNFPAIVAYDTYGNDIFER
ncbi:MAG: FumA C-terminus/TtdB family hydratase beta subunit [Bacilli bacterium]|nr:FumA C-terminus/TtdB family hydratase beta subunit [Bacilli bacterium]